jgi:penicillin-binding protein 1A
MWIDYMGKALQGVPETLPSQPPGLVTVRIDPKTGLRLRPGQEHGLFELFRADTVPEEYSEPTSSTGSEAPSGTVAEPLF